MSVCLAMIVKNEAHVIKRCLESHKSSIDYWVVADTGSSDGTQDVIRETMAGIPGELHEVPWVDFGHNRTEVVELAKKHADYVLMNDADHVLHGVIPKKLVADCYGIDYHYGGTVYTVTCLLSSRIPFRYEGVIHEYVTSATPHKAVRLEGPWIEVFHEGARSKDPETYKKDAALLEAAVAKEPDNARYLFYLAQSYRDSGQPAKALAMYQKRIDKGGWDQETWYSKYQMAILSEALNRPPQDVAWAYLEAYQFRPTRAEPLVHLARWHRLRGEIATAYLYAAQAATLKVPEDTLFVESNVYEWQALDELSGAAWYVGNKPVGQQAAEELMTRAYPESEKRRFEVNLRWYQGKQLTAA